MMGTSSERSMQTWYQTEVQRKSTTKVNPAGAH